MKRGDLIQASELKLGDRFCFKNGEQPYRITEISDSIWYILSGMRIVKKRLVTNL